MTEHASRPWEYSLSGILDDRIFDADGTTVCYMYEEVDRDQLAANFRLIAAAPDMEAILDVINDGVEGEHISMPEWLWNDVRSVLAKAKGEHEQS